MRAAFAAACAALSLLTRLPVPVKADERALRSAVVFFPWVGAALGVALAPVAPALARWLDPALAGALSVALLAAASGGLHLDGWADVFDGLGGSRGERERALSIMRDPRVGAHGASALCLLLILKCHLFARASVGFTALDWVLVPCASRAAIVPLVCFLRPAREEGLAHAVRPIRPAASCALALAALGLAAASSGRWLAAATALGAAALVGCWAARAFGGVTGDVHGAALELAETACTAAIVFGPSS